MQEKVIKVSSGAKMIVWDIILLVVSIFLFILGTVGASQNDGGALNITSIIAGIVLFVVWTVFTCGFFILQPNQAAALVLK